MATATTDSIAHIAGPVLADLGLSLYDVDVVGGGRHRTLRVLVDRAGGVDLDTVAAATRALSSAIDQADPIAGPYTLEVSSPGLERPLKRPEHFHTARGALVSVKVAGERVRGVLTEVADDGVTLDVDGTPRHFAYPDIVQARTVFEWGADAETKR